MEQRPKTPYYFKIFFPKKEEREREREREARLCFSFNELHTNQGCRSLVISCPPNRETQLQILLSARILKCIKRASPLICISLQQFIRMESFNLQTMHICTKLKAGFSNFIQSHLRLIRAVSRQFNS